MLKKTKILSVSLIVVFAVMILSAMVNPAEAGIEGINWFPPYVMKGYDSLFYHEDIVGYEEGAEALVQVPVYSDYYVGYPYYEYRPVNVSAVKVEFDWGINYTSNEVSTANPFQIMPYQRHIFTVNFTVPSTTVASNFVAHTYKIYVEHVNATTGPKEIVDTWVVNWNWWWPAYKFAVFSADQADAMDLYVECQAYYSAYPSYYFSDIEARLLASQANVEGSLGGLYYMRGDFAGAKTQYQTALDLCSQAIAAEKAWGIPYQEAMLNVTQTEAEAALTEANAAMKEAEATEMQAQAAMNQSYAYIMFGLGWIIIGIGIVIYAAKKPTTA